VFGTFWANATYIGIPLCTNAFGEAGEAKAAIYNAFVLPFFILIGYLLIGFYGDGSGRTQIRARMKKAFLNPILLSAFAGILAALIADPFRAETGPMLLPAIVVSAASLFGSFLKMIGSMGLPLALLSIGASLKWDNSGSRWMALLWTVGCKLVLLPLTTLLLVVWLLPSADRVSTGVAVILAGTPMSVAGYVISCQLGIERSFVAAMLVISTLLSVLTIPVWVYVVMGL
jgi:predicted permease